MNLPSKSKAAFLFSAQGLRPSTHGNLYLWTFTFAEVLDVAEGRRRWSVFLRTIRKRKKYVRFRGLRVFELHPGGHGLHIHVVTSCYLQVNDVRALWRKCGGGRIHVLPIKSERAAYLAKYLRKSGRPECFKGVRMWAAFGGEAHTRVKDVQVESNWTKTYAFLDATVRTTCGKTFHKMRWFERIQAVDNVLTGLPWYYALPYEPVQERCGEIEVIGGNFT
jgi:hypothetical protein